MRPRYTLHGPLKSRQINGQTHFLFRMYSTHKWPFYSASYWAKTGIDAYDAFIEFATSATNHRLLSR